jgi:hypothetical protein
VRALAKLRSVSGLIRVIDGFGQGDAGRFRDHEGKAFAW